MEVSRERQSVQKRDEIAIKLRNYYDSLDAEILELQAEIAQINSQETKLREELRSKSEELQALQLSSTERESILVQIKRKLADSEKSLSQLNGQVAELRLQLESARGEGKKYKSEAVNAIEEVLRLEVELNIVKSHSDHLAVELLACKGEMEEKSLQLTESKKDYEVVVEKMKNAEENMFALQEKCLKFETENKKLRADLNKLVKENQKITADNEQQLIQFKLRISSDSDGYLTELNRKNNLINNLEKQMLDLKAKVLDLDAVNVSNRIEFKNEIARIVHGYEAEKKRNGDLKKNEIESLCAEIKQLKQINVQQESQLQRLEMLDSEVQKYYQFGNQQRAENRKALENLAREVQCALTLHPLKDYQLVVENEMERVEIELKKLSSGSPQRNQMVSTFEQLVLQRNSIRELVKKTEKSLGQHLISIERMATEGLRIAPPPPSAKI